MDIPTCALQHLPTGPICLLFIYCLICLFLTVASGHSALVNSICNRLEILTW